MPTEPDRRAGSPQNRGVRSVASAAGCRTAQARQIFRDLIDMPADVTVSEKEVEVSFHRRAHLPILLASDLMEKRIAVPWWDGLSLRLTTYDGRQNT